MKFYTLRLALLLAITISLLALGSCTAGGDKTPEYDDKKQLSVETVRVSYSDEYIEKTNIRFGDMACALLSKLYGRELTPIHQQGIRLQFKKTFVPMFYRIRIDEKTLDSLILSLEKYLQSDTERLDSVSVLREVYERAIATIGSEKTGKIAYEIALSNVKAKADTASARYEEYGYSWYKEESDRCASLSLSLENLGEKRFIEALGSLSFLYSVLNKVGEAGESFLLTETEMLYLVEYQAYDMKERGLTEEEWATMGGLINELMPEEAATARDALLYTLKGEQYFTEVIRICPSLISLYAECAKDLRQKEISLSDTETLKSAILVSLTEGNGLISLAEKISLCAKTESASQLELIKKFGLSDDFERFAEYYPPITQEVLRERLVSAATLTGEEQDRLAEGAIISYFMGIAPYATYIFYGVN